MSAKRKAYALRAFWRPDWERYKITAMRRTLALKFADAEMATRLVATTGTIVEQSSKDQYWGTVLTDGLLIGMNILGRLLMERREIIARERGQ